MLVNENPPTIKRIDTTRDDAYAFDVTGHVTAPDIENMYGLLEGALRNSRQDRPPGAHVRL